MQRKDFFLILLRYFYILIHLFFSVQLLVKQAWLILSTCSNFAFTIALKTLLQLIKSIINCVILARILSFSHSVFLSLSLSLNAQFIVCLYPQGSKIPRISYILTLNVQNSVEIPALSLSLPASFSLFPIVKLVLRACKKEARPRVQVSPKGQNPHNLLCICDYFLYTHVQHILYYISRIYAIYNVFHVKLITFRNIFVRNFYCQLAGSSNNYAVIRFDTCGGHMSIIIYQQITTQSKKS